MHTAQPLPARGERSTLLSAAKAVAGEGASPQGRAAQTRGDAPSPRPSPRLGGAREPERPPRLKKFVYTSSTSVYGQTDGSLVKEDAPTVPSSPTSAILVETEQLLLAAATVVPAAAQDEFYHPELEWRTIETEHFFIHYHEGTERTARVAALALEFAARLADASPSAATR